METADPIEKLLQDIIAKLVHIGVRYDNIVNIIKKNSMSENVESSFCGVCNKYSSQKLSDVFEIPQKRNINDFLAKIIKIKVLIIYTCNNCEQDNSISCYFLFHYGI